jgi:hypothetical protein
LPYRDQSAVLDLVVTISGTGYFAETRSLIWKAPAISDMDEQSGRQEVNGLKARDFLAQGNALGVGYATRCAG